jgi:gliding motility-associated-like protein
VNDGSANSNTATVSITVTPVNDAPIANNQSVNVTEDLAKAITLTGSDVDGNPLSYILVGAPSHGVLSGVIPNLTYTPSLNYNGSDSFTFKVNDGSTDSNVATVSITVNPAPDAPVANNQSVTAIEDIVKSITLTGTDADGDALTYIVVAAPTHGTLNGSAPNLTYTPDLNYNGPDSFTFKVNDGSSDSNIATVTINVNPANDAPIANSQNVTYDAGIDEPITLTGSDIDGDPLTYIIVSPPSNGIILGSGANISYRPNPAFTGTDSFTFKVNDGTTDSNIATVSLFLTPVTNVAPVANNQNVAVPEDMPTSIILSATDLDGNSLSYTVQTPPVHGTLSGTEPNLIYSPDLNYTGPDSFTFKVNDGLLDSNIGTVNITVTPVNDAPTSNGQSVTTQEDVAKSITLVGNDVEGDALNYIIVSAPTHGSLTGSGSSRLYTPALNYNGADSFTFKVNDGSNDSNVSTVSITLTPVNDAPVANNSNASVQEDASTAIALTASDVDGDALIYTVLAPPTHGTLTGSAPNVTYTPNLNYAGPDSFTFKVNDGAVDSNIGTVSITVNSVNDAPIANNQSPSTQEDVPQAITLSGSDLEGDALTYIVVTSPIHGSLTGTGNNLTYTPNPNYNGSDSFPFKVNDGSADSNIATVSITVTPVNDAPAADDQSIATLEDIAKAFTLTGSDIDADVITYLIVASPANGTLTGSGANLTYTPNANYAGSDSFTFKTNDGTVDSNIATVTITVTPVNDVPVADDQNVTTLEDAPKSITLTGNDPDASVITYSIVTPPGKGTLSGTEPNITYTPNLNYNGSDSFTFRVNDGSADSNIGTVSITVTPVNDPPVIMAFPILLGVEDSLLQICLNVVDVDGDNVAFEPPSNTKGGGTAILDNAPFDFCYRFTPPLNYNGESIWDLSVVDAKGVEGRTSVKLVLIPRNDPPFALNDYIQVAGRNPSTYNVINNDLSIAPPFQEFYDIYARDSVDRLKLDKIVAGPFNGSATMLSDGTIQYTPTFEYIGADSIVYRVCDSGKPALCDTAVMFIDVTPPSFKIYEAVSPNGDGLNDYWRIDGVEVAPFDKNLVRIFDRYNNLVFETRDYKNNDGNSWKGDSNHGLVKGSLPEGTYFYSFLLDNGQLFSGFVYLKRQ